MASAFAHAVVPVVLYVAFRGEGFNWRLLLVAIAVAVLPDADVIAFKFGVPYESQWGHRGFTHSMAFSALLAAFFAVFSGLLKSRPLTVFLICFLACISHALLDALTNGGLGVALHWPVSNERFFFDFRPIQVSPIGVGKFFSDKGVKVILSELQWVILPGVAIGTVAHLLRRRVAMKHENSILQREKS